MRFLKEILNIEGPYDPAIPLLGIYPKEMRSLSRRDISTYMFTVALFTISKLHKKTKCLSLDEQVKTKCIYIMEYYSAIKKRNPAICDNMDAP